MSRIASAGVVAVMIMPGGMIALRTSSARTPRLTNAAGMNMPATSSSSVNPVIATSCGRVTDSRGASC
jgi:hypothetical protein